jgi:hypothetical protein
MVLLVVLVTSSSAATKPLREDLSTGPLPSFRWLKPSTVPMHWVRATLPNGSGELAYPPQFQRIPGDPGTLSVAILGGRKHGPVYKAYLNVTPRQGDERLQSWPAFRVGHLLDDDAVAVHEDASVENVAFGGDRRSCVIDHYSTRVGQHWYREIACLVEGRAGASVVVAAAPLAAWTPVQRVLEEAVSDYRVG